MTNEQRREKLQQAADGLMEKVTDWVQRLDPETESPQAMRQLCGTLKDLKELCACLEETQKQGITVIIEGGEEDWNN